MSITAKPSHLYRGLAALLSLLVISLLALPLNVQAIEDPPGCSSPNGGLGNTSSGGINFSVPQAHLGDTVPLIPSLGMVNNACRAINVTGSVYIASSSSVVPNASFLKLTNFLVNATLDPGVLVSCPAGPSCAPGPYNLLLTPNLVGAGVGSPNGSVNGTVKSVRAVQNGDGTVQTGNTPELLADFHSASIAIVTPCIQVVKLCAYPAGTNCFPAGAPINFTGYVTNCGDIRLTNVTVVDSRTPQLFDTTPNHLPLFQPLTLDPGQAVGFQGSFTPTLAETCAGSAANTITVRGTDVTIIGGPNASVTNTTTVSCNICVNPCLTVTKDCTPAIFGGPQTVSGVLVNCGNIAITNISVSDNIYGSITNIASLPAGGSINYSKTFTATLCGTTTNVVTAAGFTACGANIQARATNTCLVDCPPCIAVTKLVACFDTNNNCGPFGKTATGVRGDTQLPAFCYSITVSNCGAIALTNVTVNDDKLGNLTTKFFASPATVFPVGGTITFQTNHVALAVDTTNTVIATGQSQLTGQSVTDTDNAIAFVRQASVSCAMSVSSPDDMDGNPNDAHVSIFGSGSHSVTFTITATAGSVPLANVTIAAPALSGLGCSLPQVIPLLGANESTNFTCTVPVNCANIPGGILTNVAVISAQIDTSTGLCAHDATGALVRVASTNSGSPCAVVVQCIPPSCLGDFVWEDLNFNGIQDSGEPGISNVTVNLLLCGSTNVLATTITTTNGLYLFCDLMPGSYRVQVLTNNYRVTFQNSGTNDCLDSDLNPITGITDCTTLPAGVTNLCTDIGLYRPAAIGDYVWEDLNYNGVQETNEVGIPNVTVSLYDCSSNLLASTTTGPAGYYLFTNLPPGGYMVGFTGPAGYVFTLPNIGNDALDSDASAASGLTGCYTLVSGETNLTVDAGLVRPACVGDFVWDDYNRNGVQDPGEPGITSVTLLLQSCSSTNVLQMTVTGTNGYYLFCGLLPGSYRVQTVVPGGYTVTLQNSTTDCQDSDANPAGTTDCVTLSSGETNLCVDIGLYQPGAIGDYVWEDVNYNGIQETNEVGIPNVPVSLYDCGGNLLASTSTGPGGFYLFTNLPPGGYMVGFSGPSDYVFTLPNVGNDGLDSDANPVTGRTGCYTLGSGETNLTVDAGLVRPACVGDFVWDDYNRNGVQDPGEPGITNVTLLLQSCSSTNVIQTTVTSTNGYYLFCGLLPGSYRVQTVVPGGFTVTLQNSTNDCADSDADATGLTDCVTLSSGETNLCTDIGLHRPACLGDYVWLDFNQDGLQNEQPLIGVSDVTVRLFACGSSNALAVTTTDPTGYYLFCGLQPGAYQVQFVLPNGVGFTQTGAGTNGCIDSDASAAPATLGFTACVTLQSGETNRCVDAGLVPREPCLQLVKTAEKGIVSVFEPINYTYVLTNCGFVTLTNVVVRDDNGTPDYVGDDLIVGTVPLLNPGATATLVRSVRLPVQLCDAGTGTPSGEVIVVDVLTNGNILATFIQSFSVNDNTYGTNADAGWAAVGKAHKFADLTGSDKAVWEFKNGAGQVVLNFDEDYISAAPTNQYPSGYGTLGLGGDGGMNFGNPAYLLGFNTSLTDNLNKQPFLGNLPYYTVNSPGTNDPNRSLWELRMIYQVMIDKAAFGPSGFGAAAIVDQHNSPGKRSIVPVFCDWCVTNIATATTTAGTNQLAATDTARVCVNTGPLSRLGDFVWYDTNNNGRQDAGEPGVPDVEVRLLDCQGGTYFSTTTDENGKYLFPGLIAGDYTVQFVAPQGLSFSPQNVGTDDKDSDANPATGLTACITLAAGVTNLTVDAGLSDVTTNIPPTITQRGSVTISNTTTTTLIVSKPAGVVQGDVLIVNIEQGGDTVTDPTSPGWTLIDGAVIDSGGKQRRGAVLYRIAGATESSTNSYRFTLGANVNNANGVIVAFSGVATNGGFLVGGGSGGPFDVAPGIIYAPGIGSTTATNAGLTTATANAAVIMLAQMMDGTAGAAYANWITTSPGSLDELFDYNGAPATEAIGAAWATKPSAGSTGQGRVTLSSSKKWGTIMLALRPIQPVPIPTVTLTLSAGNLVFSWSTNSTGYVLESAPSLNGPWTPVNTPPQVVGDQFVVTITPTAAPQQFFRLHKP